MMIEFLLFVLLILTIVSIRKLTTIKRTLKGHGDMHHFLSSRLDYLKHEIDKLTGNIKHEHVEKKTEPKPQDVPVKTKAPERIEVKPPPVPVLPVVQTPAPEDLPQAVKVSPRKEPKFVESAKDIIKKTWNWILVGEEYRSEGITAEYAIASTWLLRVGIVAIVTCIGYFLKWSIEQELIGPAARVAISMFAGIGMLAWGMRLVGKKYHLIGQGFLGGGLLTLYFSIYAAALRYDLIPIPAAFGLMIFVTITAGMLAIRTDSLLVAILGIAGGYITPFLLGAGASNLPVLYSYILLLGVGILGIAHYKQWRLLNYLGFLCTYILFYDSLSAYDRSDFPLAISFLSVFFVIHSFIVYIHNIAKEKKSTTLDIIHLIANALVYACAGYWLIQQAHGRPYPALMSVGLAVFYITHVLIFLKKRLIDRTLLISLIALAGAFTTWTLPLLLEKESLTIALSLLAFMFLWLGRRLNSNFVENLGHLIYATVFFRLIFLDMPNNFKLNPSTSMPSSVYWKQMFERLYTFGVSIASVAGAFFLQVKQRAKDQSTTITKENNTPQLVGRGIAGGIFFWFGLLFAFLFMHFELNTMFVYCEPLRLPALTILWCVMAAYFFWKYLTEKTPGRAMLVAMCVFLTAAVLKLFIIDLASWDFSEKLIYNCEYSLLYAGMRLLDFGIILGLFWGVWWILTGRNRGKRLAPAFGYTGLFLFFIYTSLETNSLLFWKLSEFQLGGISVLWALFAIGFISAGIWKNISPLRYIGLILFAIVAGKVFLIDLKNMMVIYRVIAFMIIGITLISGSFAYIYSNKKFLRDSSDQTGGKGE
ncbi:DUF2339 domain-containing protein [Verrucomicrobiota bacterium]